jgi:hypothetical protein
MANSIQLWCSENLLDFILKADLDSQLTRFESIGFFHLELAWMDGWMDELSVVELHSCTMVYL